MEPQYSFRPPYHREDAGASERLVPAIVLIAVAVSDPKTQSDSGSVDSGTGAPAALAVADAGVKSETAAKDAVPMPQGIEKQDRERQPVCPNQIEAPRTDEVAVGGEHSLRLRDGAAVARHHSQEQHNARVCT